MNLLHKLFHKSFFDKETQLNIQGIVLVGNSKTVDTCVFDYKERHLIKETKPIMV